MGGDMDVSKIGSKLAPEVEVKTAAGCESISEVVNSEQGSELLTEVASLTGLPVDWVHTELTQIVKKSGHTPEQLTLEELRASMLVYLEEMNRELMAQEMSDLDLLDSMSVPTDLSH